METASSWKPKTSTVFLWVVGLGIPLLAVFALIPSTPVFHPVPFTDSAIFQWIGEKITEGKLPFRDVYDHKPPLIFYLNALGFLLGRDTPWGIWALEVVSLTFAGFSACALLKRYFGKTAAFLSVAAMMINLSFVLEFGNLTEEYALPFQFAAVYFLSRSEDGNKPVWSLLAVGIMLGMASTLKQTMAAIGIGIAFYLLVRSLIRRDLRGLVQSYFWIGLGGLLVWGAWFAYFAGAGIFKEFWEAAFQYNVALSNISLEKRLESLFVSYQILSNRTRFFLTGAVLWLFTFPYLLVTEKPASGWLSAWKPGTRTDASTRSASWLLPLTIAFIDFPVAVATSSLSGNHYQHYFMAMLPSVTILLASGISLLVTMLRQTVRQPLASLWAGALMVIIFWPGIERTLYYYQPKADMQNVDAAEFVQTHTRPEDRILQWGISAPVYLLSKREAPSRFFFMDPLFVEGYSGQEKAKLFLSEIKQQPPRLIIDEGVPRLPLIMAPPDQCGKVKDPHYYKMYTDRRFQEQARMTPPMPSGIGDVYFWICENYLPDGQIGRLGWEVYRLKGN